MEIFKKDIEELALSTGFLNKTLEKTLRLVGILNQIFSNSFLGERLALKGGTALNLFVFNLPRLSLDIDLNYVGKINRDEMLEERSKLESSLEKMFVEAKFIVKRIPTEHAGGKWRLIYTDVNSRRADLEVDLNYLYRIPFWETCQKDFFVFTNYKVANVRILDVHELAAGKLAALFGRQASRDLHDVYHLLREPTLEWEKLRFTFVLYVAMSRGDFRQISLDNIGCDLKELESKLRPVLNTNETAKITDWNKWADTLLNECKQRLSCLLPFRPHEYEFLERLHNFAELRPSLLTNEEQMIQKIEMHPALLWRVKQRKKNGS